MKIRAIKHKVSVLSKIKMFLGHFFKPVVFNAVKLVPAVTRDPHELPNRIAFFDPEPEPVLLLAFLGARTLPGECSSTLVTSKTLFARLGFTMQFYLYSCTVGTLFFDSFFSSFIKPV